MDKSEDTLQHCFMLIQAISAETAYQKLQDLSPESQNLYFGAYTALANTHHLLGDSAKTNDPSIRALNASVAIRNLQSFIAGMAASAQRDLVFEEHAIRYEQEAEEIIRELLVEFPGSGEHQAA